MTTTTTIVFSDAKSITQSILRLIVETHQALLALTLSKVQCSGVLVEINLFRLKAVNGLNLFHLRNSAC